MKVRELGTRKRSLWIHGVKRAVRVGEDEFEDVWDGIFVQVNFVEISIGLGREV